MKTPRSRRRRELRRGLSDRKAGEGSRNRVDTGRMLEDGCNRVGWWLAIAVVRVAAAGEP